MFFLPSALIFVSGLCVGSFLSLVFYRLPKGQSIVFKRSYCPYCKHKLTPTELIPLLSFIVQFGRCRSCQKPIPFRYPAIEFTTGVLFLLSYASWLKSGPLLVSDLSYLLFLFFTSSLLFLVFLYDAKYSIIPDQFVLTGVFITIGYLLLNFLTGDTSGRIFWETVLLPVVSGALLTLFFLSIILVTRGRGMGMGDAKLGFLLGLLVPFPKLLLLLFLAFLIGALFSLFLVVLSQKKLKDTVPFGPFLVVGTLLAIFYGEEIISFYLQLL